MSSHSPSRLPQPVHPHVRGANLSRQRLGLRALGSSPRAWGQCRLPECLWCHLCIRFIPTCVGPMLPRAPPILAGAVHPHVRGANAVSSRFPEGGGGSSPRAWGQLRGAGAESPRSRFIPTCVGPICRRESPGRRSTVHPHVRGANLPAVQKDMTDLGSSPRAWGQFGLAVPGQLVRRFIPTCVGPMAASAPKSRRRSGSSPRAWGQ